MDNLKPEYYSGDKKGEFFERTDHIASIPRNLKDASDVLEKIRTQSGNVYFGYFGILVGMRGREDYIHVYQLPDEIKDPNSGTTPEHLLNLSQAVSKDKPVINEFPPIEAFWGVFADKTE